MAYNYEWPYTDPNRYNDDWLLKAMLEVKGSVDSLNEWKEQHKKEYAALEKFIDDVKAGRFPDSIKEAFNKWMRENATDIVAELIKMVWFGINDNGYFVAYIPESWNDIVFNTTGLDIVIEDYEYGRLVLSMKVGGN